jgi:hypothetical protein
MSNWQRKPDSELRHWSTYGSVGEWFHHHHDYVPIETAAGLSRVLRDDPGMTFPAAYARLLHARATICIDPADDALPAPTGAAPIGRDVQLSTGPGTPG